MQRTTKEATKPLLFIYNMISTLKTQNNLPKIRAKMSSKVLECEINTYKLISYISMTNKYYAIRYYFKKLLFKKPFKVPSYHEINQTK